MSVEKIKNSPCILPFFPVGIPAGFPSPADYYIDNDLDLHDYLVMHPAATFLHRVDGRSMEGAGIMDGDIVVVDRALPLIRQNEEGSSPLMAAMDAINGRYGRHTVRLAGQGFEEVWRLKAEHRSPRYTTCWNNLPIIKSIK